MSSDPTRSGEYYLDPADQPRLWERVHKTEKDVAELKTTVIGLDGQNGLRSQIRVLQKDMTAVKARIEEVRESNEDLLEHEMDEIKVMIEEQERRREEAREHQQERYQDIRLIKVSLLLVMLGILAQIGVALFA